MDEAGPTISVCPSAADFATKSAPMVPDAPDLFSTMTEVSHKEFILGAKIRATISGPAPAVNGTINLTVPLIVCAKDPKGMAPKVEKTLPSLMNDRREQ